MITNVDKKIADALNKGEEYWTFKEDAERDYVHGLFAYPAMMVPKMQREILEAFSNNLPSSEGLTIFDPFMGSGTILVEGMLRGYNIIGVDINPLAYLVAKVKTEIYSIKRLKNSVDSLLSRISKDAKIQNPTKFENIEKWFKPEIIAELDVIKQEIRKENCLKIRRFMWAVFSDTVRTVSNARSCTYKLYMKTEKAIESYDKSPIEVFSEYIVAAYDGIVRFQEKLEAEGYLVDTKRGKKYKGSIDIRLANTIDIASQICEEYNPNLVITSPPYGDNETTVTYGQYSVLELRWMDLNDIKCNIDTTVIDSQSRIDRISMGGTIEKSQCAQQKIKIAVKSPTLHNQIEQIEKADKNKVWKVISFYNDFDDFASTLSKLKTDSYLIMTVGNRTVAKQKIKMNEIMKELCDWCGILEKDYPDYEVIKKARISECYDSFVNTRYLPIASGDIFEIGDAYFILIGQSCNLTIRENGERKAQCATLARISKDNENDQKAISKYPLHYFRENEIWSIDFNDCINVDFSVLDLCTLNATGKAELDDAYNLADVRYRYTNAIYKKLKNTVDYSRELIRQYRGLADGFSRKEISFEDVCAGIRKIYKDNSAEVSPSFRGGLMFNIARYARISSDILDDILKQYAEYHSRKGLQHDFAKEYKSMTYDVGYEVDWLSYGVDESEAKNALIPQYVFYQSGSYKNDELKKAVLNDFREYYTNAVFDGLGCKPSDQCKCDIKKKALTVPSKDIPVQIGDESFIDVLRCAKDGKCTYRIPVNKISVWKNKQNQTAKMDNGAQVSISNNVATFTFPNGVSHEFFLDNVVEQPISFKLVILQKICLQITYSNQPEIVLENSTATVMA